MTQVVDKFGECFVTPERIGKRQSRAEVARVLEKSGIADQMKTYGLWADWESGKRGRK